MIKKFKRYCKTIQLENDLQSLEEYKKLHAAGEAWPEISRGIKEIGIIDMEIYIEGNTLFMIMDTVEEFDHEKAMTVLASLPRQAEWETTVSKYQKTSAGSSAKEKWKLIERIYKLDQDAKYKSEGGYIEQIKI